VTILTASQVRSKLSAACVKAGGQKAWAKENGVTQAYVCDVLSGRRDAGASIAKGLGLERFVGWRKNVG
jgi:hypothetical protein